MLHAYTLQPRNLSSTCATIVSVLSLVICRLNSLVDHTAQMTCVIAFTVKTYVLPMFNKVSGRAPKYCITSRSNEAFGSLEYRAGAPG
jgi:hypothetical protein